jgi:hypothetical protein
MSSNLKCCKCGVEIPDNPIFLKGHAILHGGGYIAFYPVEKEKPKNFVLAPGTKQ